MTSAEGAALTAWHRRQQLALRATVMRDLLALWSLLDPARLDASFPRWALEAIRIIRERHNISAGLAASYLRAFRAAEEIPGEIPLVLADEPPIEQMRTALHVTSVAAVKKATARGVPTGTALRNAFVLSSGAASRLAMGGGRATITSSVAADEYAQGWRRVTGGRSCGFCRMLASRGAVYRGEDTAAFASHDHCGCSAEPAYDPARRRAADAQFTGSARRLSEETRAANDARARAFIRDNNPG